MVNLIPDKKTYREFQVNTNSKVINIEKITLLECENICKKIKESGFCIKESSEKPLHYYWAFSKDDEGIFLNYFKNLSELNIVIEKNCRYFSYSDSKGDSVLSPEITQISLEDFGMSYAIRVSDGRFIVIDGGWNLKPDADKLFNVLKEGSITEKPVIAAWIMTHAHIDHYRCFNEFVKWYSDEVIVEKFILNFPDEKKLTKEKFNRPPEIMDLNYNFNNSTDCEHITLMYDNIKKIKAEIFIAHTGQVYNIGDAKLEFLSTIDDICCFTDDENSASLVFKMELGGQSILWTGDASFSHSRLSSKYEDYIKADILQIPHHGFGSGSFEEQIICYDLISPSVCFLPVSDYNAYSFFCPYKEGTLHLIKNVNLDELITGDITKTITLPYKAPDYKKNEIKEKISDGINSAGSKVWVFSGLKTSCKKDFMFEFLNLTNSEISVMAELYFDSPKKRITNIKIKVPRATFKKINILDKNIVELNSAFFNHDSYNKKGIPKRELFAVRFLSKNPVVISHDKHKASYIL